VDQREKTFWRHSGANLSSAIAIEQLQNIAWRELGGVSGFKFSQLLLAGIDTNRTHFRRMTPRKG